MSTRVRLAERPRTVEPHQIAAQAAVDIAPGPQPRLGVAHDVLVDGVGHRGGPGRRPLDARVLAPQGGLQRLAGPPPGIGQVDHADLAEGHLDRLAGKPRADGEAALAARLHHEIKPGLLPVGDLDPLLGSALTFAMVRSVSSFAAIRRPFG